ncbi:relaxase/mobilization nuclease RlxS [Sphingobium subterraneum]|uniref:Type IV secretory pathway VirD2 relaxase n=1 Tax=Sphingobium subterraneum TaxID=627688 RepID=A0A841J3K7_9SPHN|nr:relaxase/mobilization nuclease RlxS [Sphingobium subterraneum]MBB6125397.1 type IV secretory pathway VirD2 relaxase [Sphingobium subterraneum]
MSDEDEFTPRLGKPRARGQARSRTYLGAVVGGAARAGITTAKRAVRFDGSRIGRGASIGRVLSGRDRLTGLRGRRAVVKAKLVRLGAARLSAARTHLRYIQRDGVTREGGSGQLYSATSDDADGRAFIERAGEDRHQFRFIVSAEDGDHYADLKPFTRRLMTQMEQDLGTKLDWVAVDHFNTGFPHTHIILRGRDDRGDNLVIAREYLSHGLRERAAELVTLDLGPRTTLEIEERLRHDMDAERLTPIDRRMVRDMDEIREIGQSMRDPFQQSLRMGRLRKLEAMGLAEPVGGGRWQLAEGIEETLRHMGERGDIIRTMQRAMAARNRAGVEQHIFDAADTDAAPIIGRVIGRGLADELKDRHYLLVDGVDGRSHYVDIGTPVLSGVEGGEEIGPTPEGAIVRIAPARGGVRAVDRTVADIAVANGGRYSVDIHLRHDPSASEAFAETHVRRLEAIRRLTSGVERLPDGSWDIAPDHLTRVDAYEARLLRTRPVTIETLSPVPIEKLGMADAATWLDQRIAGEETASVRDAGFGREVRQAETLRRQWLVEQGLAEEQNAGIRLRADALAVLRRRELLRVADHLSNELGLAFVETKAGERIEGALRRQVETLGGGYALVEKSREFTLVPWRPALERHIGRPLSGIMRSDGISWTFGRGRGGPSL